MRESVAAVFRYQEKIFFIERNYELSVFPGYSSFPGGKVDKTDQGLEAALEREVQEECGISLDELEKNSQIEKRTYLGTATTPSFNPYRFVTHYYLIDFKEKPELTLDHGEVRSSCWKTAKEFLDSWLKNDVLIVPPMKFLLEALSNQNESFPRTFDIEDVDSKVPLIEPTGGVRQFLPLSHTFPPANRTNCFLIGENPKLTLVDPSPKSMEEYQKLKNTFDGQKIDQILITHHHPDHHEYAPKLAKELNIPILISEDSLDRIKAKYDEKYFDTNEVRIVKNDDVLSSYQGIDILLLSVPGHDRGQLAPYRKDMKWMIVGDLIQTVGTVVIGAPEGDMKEYFESLNKVIKMNPGFIFPSHGIGLGGVNKLKMTLKHRMHREEQIIELMESKQSEEEILNIVYEGLDPKLEKYALKTIRAHLDKIKNDRRS